MPNKSILSSLTITPREKMSLLAIFLTIIFWVIVVQAVFYLVQRNQAAIIANALLSQFRQEQQDTNFLKVSRHVSDLTKAGTIRCAVLSQPEFESGLIIDLRTLESCNSISQIQLDGSNISQEISTLSGLKFSLNYWTKNSPIFYMALWIVRVGGFLLLILGFFCFQYYAAAKRTRYEAEIEIANSKFEIARQVAHDIRSPLSAIYSAISLMQSDSDQVDLLKKACRRVEEIASDLLVASRSQLIIKSRNGNSQEIFEVNMAVRTIIEERFSSIPKNFEIHFEPLNSELLVRGDRKEVLRILSNVLNNSLEATSMVKNIRTPSIGIFLRDYPEEFVISISDNGVGIAKDLLAEILNGSSVTNKDNGSGLGLSHATKYMKSIGGDLRIQSSLDVGSIVSIHFLKE